VVVAVEAEDLLGCLAGVVGDAVEDTVLGRDEAPGEHLLVHEALEGGPVAAAGGVQQHDGCRVGLARLRQGEQLERLVEGAVAAGQDHERVRFLQEHHLAGEEVLHGDELGIAGDELVRPLLEREADVDPERPVPPRALQAGGHDPRAGAGHDHPAGVGDEPRRPARLGVGGVVGQGPGRAEHGDLADVPVGGEDPERPPQLLQGGVGDLDVQAVDVVGGQPQAGRQDLEQLVAVGGRADLVEQRGDALVELGVPGAVAGEAIAHGGKGSTRQMRPRP
jgi:hypothetical protein